MTDPIVAFLRACLDEDEQAARAAPQGEPFDGQWVVDGIPGQEGLRTYNGWTLAFGHADSSGQYHGLPAGFADHVARWDPARVLAEVESKRRIMYEHRDGYDPCDAHDASLCSIPCETLRLLTLPYADRLGYDPTWKI